MSRTSHNGWKFDIEQSNTKQGSVVMKILCFLILLKKSLFNFDWLSDLKKYGHSELFTNQFIQKHFFSLRNTTRYCLYEWIIDSTESIYSKVNHWFIWPKTQNTDSWNETLCVARKRIGLFCCGFNCNYCFVDTAKTHKLTCNTESKSFPEFPKFLVNSCIKASSCCCSEYQHDCNCVNTFAHVILLNHNFN